MTNEELRLENDRLKAKLHQLSEDVGAVLDQLCDHPMCNADDSDTVLIQRGGDEAFITLAARGLERALERSWE